MTAYPGQTRMMLSQLCAALWDSQLRPDVMQPGFEPGTAVTPLALRSSALDSGTPRPPSPILHSLLPSFSPFHSLPSLFTPVIVILSSLSLPTWHSTFHQHLLHPSFLPSGRHLLSERDSESAEALRGALLLPEAMKKSI